MLLNLQDIFEIIKILALITASCFAMYLPLRAVLKEPQIALGFTVPVSISVQIAFGYIFYSFGNFSRYPYFYLALIVCLNIVGAIKARPKKFTWRYNFNFLKTLALLILGLATIYHFFADGLSTVAPGTIDTTNHLNYLFGDFKKYGFLSFPSYPPGFHILLYPLTLISNQIPVYRFAGPLIGLFTVLALILACKNIFKHKISIAVLMGVLLMPLFDQLTLQLIGFFPTALSFIFIIFLLLIILEERISNKFKALLSIIVFASMGLTIPYLTVQLLPCLIALAIFSFFTYRIKKPRTHKAIIIAALALLFSFLVAFGHVYLQSSILKRTTGFPAIESVDNGENGLTIKNNYQNENEFFDHLPPILRSTFGSPVARNYVLPMLFTGKDVILIKNIRSFQGALSIGAYCLILIALVTAVVKRKEANLVTLSIFVLIFGISVQTGILEMSTYRGRSGYYMLFFSALLIASLIDHYYKRKYQKSLLIIIGALVASSFFQSPKYYRDYYPEYFDIAHKILKENPGRDILLETNRASISSISTRLKTVPLSSDSDLDQCDYDRCFVILEKNYLWLDPVLSQRSYAADKDSAAFNDWQKKAAKEQESLSALLRNKIESKNHVPYFENQNLLVFEFTEK